MMSDVREAIAHLYAVFSNYRAGAVSGCACCVSPEQQRRLTSKRLCDLTEDDLGSFALKALQTWGTLDDFKHFLPRILELKARGQLWTDLQVVYGKFTEEGPWPTDEREALERFTSAWLLDVMGGARHVVRARDIIESAGLADMNVHNLLDGVIRAQGWPHATQVAHLVIEEATAYATGLPGWIWLRGDRAFALHRWLFRDIIYEYLREAFDHDANHPDARDWAEACDILEALGVGTTVGESKPSR